MRRKLYDATATDSTSCMQLLGKLMDLARNNQLDSLAVLYWPRRHEGGQLPMRHAFGGWAGRRPADVHLGAGRLMSFIENDPESE